MSEALPAGWVMATLEEVATWSSGGTPSRSNPSFFSGSIPWFKTGELGPRKLFEAEEHITELALRSSSAKLFPPGAVLLAMYGATIGKASVLAVPASTNQACAVGVPDVVSSDFLYLFLTSQTKGFVDAGKGGAQPNISQGLVKAWPIAVPPAAEQARIVSKLEELLSDLDAGVAELKAAQKKLQQYRQSLLKAAFEGSLTAAWRKAHPAPEETGADLLARILRERRTRWEAQQLAKFEAQGKAPPKGWQGKYPEPSAPDTSALGDLPSDWAWASVEQLGSVQLGRQRSPDKVGGADPTPYIRAANIREAGVDLSDVLLMDFSESEKSTFALRAGDVLLTEASGSPEHVGRPAIWRHEGGLYCFQNTVLRFRSPSVSPEFAYLSFLAMQKLGIFRRLSGGVGINHLSAGKFSTLPVALPPIYEQLELVRLLTDAFALCDRELAAIEKVEAQSTAQRQNLLRAAFAGQLVPQDPADEHAAELLARIRAERAAHGAARKPRAKPARGPHRRKSVETMPAGAVE